MILYILKESYQDFQVFFLKKDIFNYTKFINRIYIFLYQPISYISFLFAKNSKEVWSRPHGSLINTYSKDFQYLRTFYLL